MVVARGPCGNQLKRGVHLEERRIDPGRKVDAENFRIGMDLFCSGEKTQIVFGERGLEVFLFQLLGLGELYLHGEWPSAINRLSSHSLRVEPVLTTFVNVTAAIVAESTRAVDVGPRVAPLGE
jgi:hypothetical protein